MTLPSAFDLDSMVDDLGQLVSAETPSRDIDRLTVHARLISGMMVRLLGSAPELIDSPDGPHVHWRGGGEPRVLILGHHDTVHPAGTLAQRPFTNANGELRGPGVFDMKAGIVQAVAAVRILKQSGADVSGGGVRLNMIPRDGGNTFSGSLFTGFQNQSFQGNNITSSLIARGVKTADGIGKLWNTEGSLGGPISKDKV